MKNPVHTEKTVSKYDNGGDGLVARTFYSVHLRLSQRLITHRIGKIVGAVRSTVVDKDMTAFNTTFVIVEELTLGVEKFWALFARDR